MEALSQGDASNKVVEIVQGKQVEKLPTSKYFSV